MARGDLMGSGMLVALLHIVASRRKQGPGNCGLRRSRICMPTGSATARTARIRQRYEAVIRGATARWAARISSW